MTSRATFRGEVRVLLRRRADPPPRKPASDVGAGGYFTVQQQRLYDLVKLAQADEQVLTVQLPPGISAYDFTFG